jgi:glycosyltransferase involved in cell wall biosynthesis
MNIGLLHYAASPVVGGVESVLGQHARLMADAGHRVCVIAGRGAQVDPRIPFLPLPLADSRHPQVLAVKAKLDAGQIPPEFADLVTTLAKTLAQMTAGLDLLIAHNVCSLNKNLVLTAALRSLLDTQHPPRLILWHHDLAWTTPRYRAELHAGHPWDLLRTAWPGVTQVTVSELRRNELAELLGLPLENIAVVPNGVDVPQFLKLELQTQDFVKQLNLLEAAPLLLLPVRITPRKNIELALRVLALLRQGYPQVKYPQAALVVTGPLGPHNPANVEYFNRLTALRGQLGLQGAAHFLAELYDEYLPDSVIADFYRLADALFLPSREEGFGIPVLEAGLAGLPVFCSDIPPLRKLGGDQAFYFPVDADPQEVCAQLAGYLATDPVFGLRTRVRRQYTWERVYSELIVPLLKLT